METDGKKRGGRVDRSWLTKLTRFRTSFAIECIEGHQQHNFQETVSSNVQMLFASELKGMKRTSSSCRLCRQIQSFLSMTKCSRQLEASTDISRQTVNCHNVVITVYESKIQHHPHRIETDNAIIGYVVHYECGVKAGNCQQCMRSFTDDDIDALERFFRVKEMDRTYLTKRLVVRGMIVFDLVSATLQINQ